MSILALCLAPILAVPKEDSAKQVFLATMNSYGKLDSLSIDIESDGASGLFPGKFTQHLDFVKSKGFRLKLDLEKGQIRPEGAAPDYYCDGADVTTVGNGAGVRPINKDANVTPGYEVAGGFIVTWLLDSPTKRLFTSPPEGFSIDMSRGSRKEWRGDKVSELIATISAPGSDKKQTAEVYLSPDEKRMIGFEWNANGKVGYMRYSNQKDNPTIDIASFKPPI